MNRTADVWISARKGKRRTTYRVRWADPETGKVRCHSCGPDKAAAQDFRSKKRKALRDGVNDETRPISWGAFTDKVLSELRAGKRSKLHIAGVERTLRDFGAVCRLQGPVDATKRALAEYRKIMADREYAPRTINNRLNMIAGPLGMAAEWEYIPGERPTIKRPKNPNPSVRALDPDEKARVLAACPDAKWRAYVLLGSEAGLRPSELRELHWDRVCLDGASPSVVITDAKTETGNRALPLTPAIVEALQQVQQADKRVGGRVFVRQSQRGPARWLPWSSTYIAPVFRKLAVTANVPDLTPKHLRKTFPTMLAAAGVNQKIIKDLCGHASMSTTAVYYQAGQNLTAGRKAIEDAFAQRTA